MASRRASTSAQEADVGLEDALKLATFPGENNVSPLIFELARAGLVEAWVSPAILEEYADVLGDQPEFVAEIVESCSVCHPLTELSVIGHEPDNRFLECALAVCADFIVTVNTAPGHFDGKKYQDVTVVRPGRIPQFPGLVGSSRTSPGADADRRSGASFCGSAWARVE